MRARRGPGVDPLADAASTTVDAAALALLNVAAGYGTRWRAAR